MIIGYVAVVILTLLALAGISLEKAYFYLPIVELRRRAEKGDRIAASLAAVARFGDELRLLLVATAWLSAAIGVVLLVRLTHPAIGLVGTLVVLVGLFFWQTRAPLTAAGARFAVLCAAPLEWALPRLQPALSGPSRLFARYHLHRTHTGLYELPDLVSLLERQRRQRDNRISPSTLELVGRAVEASATTVGELMTPRNRVIAVKAEDEIGPIMIDELHKSGHALFLVYEGAKDHLVGVLRLQDVADVRQHGTVSAAATRRLAYLDRGDPVTRAVRAFYETHQELFVVLDGRGKYIGILTIGDIFNYLFGALEHEKFGRFDDPEATGHKTVAKDTTEVVE